MKNDNQNTNNGEQNTEYSGEVNDVNVFLMIQNLYHFITRIDYIVKVKVNMVFLDMVDSPQPDRYKRNGGESGANL